MPNKNGIFAILKHMVRPWSNAWYCDEINIRSAKLMI